MSGLPRGDQPVKEQIPRLAAKSAIRRSTRVAQAVPLVIRWLGTKAKELEEETATLSINCHGCRYFSRFHLRKNTRVTVHVGAAMENPSSAPQSFPARVAWTRKSRRLNGSYLVGVEFEVPQNLWHVEDAPEDWEPFSSPAWEDSESVSTEVERLLQLVQTGTYYQILGVQPDTPRSEVKRRFYYLASRFHPDHHMDFPEWMPRLSVLMDALTMAYRTLSDDESKNQYDSRLTRMSGEEISGPQRLARECLEMARECLEAKNYIGSILWLRRTIETEPNSSSYRAMLASSLAAVPEYRHEAIEQFEKAIELDSMDITVHLQYARLLEKMRFPLRARPLYLRVLELDVNHREAREGLERLGTAVTRPKSRSSLLGRLASRYGN